MNTERINQPAEVAPTLAESIGRLRNSIEWLRDGNPYKRGMGIADMVVIEAALSQQAVQAKPLTGDEILKLWGSRSDGPDNHEILSFARAIEAELRGAAAPDADWVTVPRNPTTEMMICGTEWIGNDYLVGKCYRAMIAAAPTKQDGAK